TEAAREAKIEGTVKLATIIGTKGEVSKAEVIQGLDAGLDANAIAAVLTWKFEPATKDGKPVKAKATIEVNFRLL
ncbi:energy transducer TonB, partial [Salmonella sp. SAL4444]|uniref:energy transducer TonB n=1 Tax=Salmonella sp. SAL4444 TaxID=3159899 RepID=UPI003978702F